MKLLTCFYKLTCDFSCHFLFKVGRKTIDMSLI